jgi:hypothetical protein
LRRRFAARWVRFRVFAINSGLFFSIRYPLGGTDGPSVINTSRVLGVTTASATTYYRLLLSPPTRRKTDRQLWFGGFNRLLRFKCIRIS